MANLLSPIEAYTARWASGGLLVGAVLGYLLSRRQSRRASRHNTRKDGPMFDISTRLVRTGRDTNVYHWAGKDPMFCTALLGALMSVLGTSLHSAGGEPAAGAKSVTLMVTVTFNGLPWIDAPITLASLTDEDERAVMNALSAAVRPYRDAAVRAKA